MADYIVAYDGLDSLLQSLPDNTSVTAYSVELSSVTASFLDVNSSVNISTVLRGNGTKYVSLTFGTDCNAIFAELTRATAMFVGCGSIV